MARHRLFTIALVVASLQPSLPVAIDAPRSALKSSPPVRIPLAAHPRPDFQREEWQNLNGSWQFQFDGQGGGEAQGWSRSELPAPRAIVVPFPWGTPLSGVPDSACIARYAGPIAVPAGSTTGR